MLRQKWALELENYKRLHHKYAKHQKATSSPGKFSTAF